MGQVSLAEAKHGSIGYHFENEMWYCGPLKFPWSSKRPLVVEIPLVVETAKIPLDEGTLAIFSELEKLLSNACLIAVQNGFHFQVDTDTSDYAIAAIQSHGDRRLPLMSRTLHPSEKHYERSHYQYLSC